MRPARLPYRDPAPELARRGGPVPGRSRPDAHLPAVLPAGADRGDRARRADPPGRRPPAPDLAAALTESYGTAPAATWNRAATLVRGFAAWCAEQGWTAEDQLPRLAKLTRRRRPRPPGDRVLPVEVIDRLCRRPDLPLREKTLWRLAYEPQARQLSCVIPTGLLSGRPGWRGAFWPRAAPAGPPTGPEIAESAQAP